MLQLTYHNSEIDWKIGAAKAKKRERKRRISGEEKRKGVEKAEKQKDDGNEEKWQKSKRFEIKKKKQQDQKKSQFQKDKQIKIFEKKTGERILTRKIQDYVIDLKKGFMPRKGKSIAYPEKRERK